MIKQTVVPLSVPGYKGSLSKRLRRLQKRWEALNMSQHDRFSEHLFALVWLHYFCNFFFFLRFNLP